MPITIDCQVSKWLLNQNSVLSSYKLVGIAITNSVGFFPLAEVQIMFENDA